MQKSTGSRWYCISQTVNTNQTCQSIATAGVQPCESEKEEAEMLEIIRPEELYNWEPTKRKNMRADCLKKNWKNKQKWTPRKRRKTAALPTSRTSWEERKPHNKHHTPPGEDFGMLTGYCKHHTSFFWGR